MYDVVTLGETMLRLTPVDGLRWEQAERFDMHVGGSESNVAVGLSRLGHSVAWVSRLTSNAFGRKISSAIAAHGVDVQHMVWTDEDRIGTYYYEPALQPRASQVIYDRAHSSFSRFSADMLPKSLFVQDGARWLHVSGISLGLGVVSQQLIERSVRAAKDAGWMISFDVNYRAKLWSPADAARICANQLSLADLVILPIRDAIGLWYCGVTLQQVESDPSTAAATALDEFRKHCSAKVIAMTLGAQGSAVLSDGKFYYSPAIKAETVGRLGGGDAFAAGFLSGLLQSHDADTALRWGNAAASLKYSIAGDLPYFTRYEVESLVASANSSREHFR